MNSTRTRGRDELFIIQQVWAFLTRGLPIRSMSRTGSTGAAAALRGEVRSGSAIDSSSKTTDFIDQGSLS